jgi:2-oxoglutarate/2-oxoacid ferredoxin oxidoreductase subunit beta
MDKKEFDVSKEIIAWCPGCGNFGILNAVKQALAELEIKPQQLVMVSGIGQAAKLPQYLRCNYFNGLHGRSLPPATAIKAVNPELTVIAESGDGCTYGEGGNHFIHTIRRNPNITNIVHDNMVYGLTKGQASPTSRKGFVTPVQWNGVFLEPFNPLSVAIALDASFVARAFIGDMEKTKEIIKRAILHKGYAVVDILQPCVTFNKINTYAWFKENTYYLESTFDPQNRTAAFQRATETEKLPLGIFYMSPQKSTFEENLVAYQRNATPILNQKVDRIGHLKKIMQAYR